MQQGVATHCKLDLCGTVVWPAHRQNCVFAPLLWTALCCAGVLAQLLVLLAAAPRLQLHDLSTNDMWLLAVEAAAYMQPGHPAVAGSIREVAGVLASVLGRPNPDVHLFAAATTALRRLAAHDEFRPAVRWVRGVQGPVRQEPPDQGARRGGGGHGGKGGAVDDGRRCHLHGAPRGVEALTAPP